MMNALTVLLLCLAAACAVPVHFPAEKTVIYNYYADVKTGTVEPVQYASQFALNGQLHIRKDVSDPSLNNAYYVKLHNLKYGMFNGMVEHHKPIEVVHELGEAAQQIQDPFVIVYNENGKFEGVKIAENESGWSRNMKQGIASMLQLDMTHVQLQTPMRPHSFVTHEKTIHGTCQVTYNVHQKNPANTNNNKNVFVVQKMHDLMNCSHFVQRVFDHVECEKCHVESVDDMTSAANRVFEIEQQNDDVIIKRLVAHSVINYFPYNAQSEAHFLLTNTTLDLHSIELMEVPLTAMNFQTVPIVRDVTFNKPMGNYALHAAEDLTHGRHIVKLDTLIPKLKKMLVEAVDYLEENHLEAKEPDWKHGQTINRLQHTMSYMDLGSLEQVYNAIQDPKTPKEKTMKDIFLQMIPTVGTTAACHFTRNVIRKHKVSDAITVAMLTKLPMYVKVPSERLLLEMEDLLKLSNTASIDVRKISILCFSNLIRKTFIHQQGEIVNPLLEKYVHRFFDHVKNEQLYEMKMTYLMAMKNVQVGGIEKLLEPIIRGQLSISEHPHHIRVQAIWAIKKAVADKVEYTHNLLWPILADVTQPLSIRVVAYDVLMSQLPNMQRLMSMYWLMVHEPNNHMYNYHYTTLKGLANSVDPCLTPVREMVRKVLRFTQIRPTIIALSSNKLMDYTDPVYEHGESWKVSMVLEETTGLPHAGYIEHRTSVARKSVNTYGLYWSAYGLDEVTKKMTQVLMGWTTVEKLNNKNVQNILMRAAQDMPKKKPIHIDVCFTLNGHVVIAMHLDENTFWKGLKDIVWIKQIITDKMPVIVYDNFYEMQVPTDMGLQAVLTTKIPKLKLTKHNDVPSEFKTPHSINTKLEVDIRDWRHGEYVISIYNPIADVWHSIRRATVQDVVVPIDISINYNYETKSLKLTMPRLPATKLSYTGMQFHAKNLVTITEDEQDVLKVCCATCHHHTVVTTGEKKNYHVAMDSKDVGLKFTTAIFDCETDITPISNAQEWQRVLSPEHKNTWGSEILRVIMGMRQKLINDFISPKVGSCGMVMKMEPSIVYPTSHVDLNVRVNVEDVNHVHEKMHAINGNKINIRGTLDAKAASTNESVCSWDMNVNIDMSQGHVFNNVKVQMTRATPGEKHLKICIDAQKSYPAVETNPLKVDSTKQETNTKMAITAGFTDEDKCVRDDMSIVICVKGEMTEEQKRKMAHDSVHGSCVKDIQSLQFQTVQNHIPKTMNCIHESIQHTTMKKYTINASYKKVPVQVFSQLNQFEDHFRALHLPHVKYIVDRTPSGNAQVVMEFSSDLSHINATVVTPISGYKYVQIPMHQQSVFEGMSANKAMSHPTMWHNVMDNTRFSVINLYKVLQGHSKICTIYPRVIITFDNGMIPFVLSNKWTLVSGDHIDQTYAVFVKSVQNDKLAMKVYVTNHEVDIMPNDVGVVVSVDGNVIDQPEKGIVVPQDDMKSYAIKITENYEHLVVQSQRVPMIIMWTSDSVTLMMSSDLQGHVTGMCGHMDNTHKEKLSKVYTNEL